MVYKGIIGILILEIFVYMLLFNELICVSCRIKKYLLIKDVYVVWCMLIKIIILLECFNDF